MKRKRLTLAAVSVTLLLSTVNAQAAQLPGQTDRRESEGNVVTEWNAIAQIAFVTISAQPIQRSQLWMTLVHVAIYDAVTSINRDYEQFKVTPLLCGRRRSDKIGSRLRIGNSISQARAADPRSAGREPA